MKVSDLMTTDVVTVKDTDPIAHARRLLGDQQFHAVPVVDPWGYLCGIVTCADFVEVQGDETRHPVRDVMQRRVYTLPATVDAVLVARFMAKYHVRHLVVVRDGKVHGILSTFDLLRALAEQGTHGLGGEPRRDPRAELEEHGLKFLDVHPDADAGVSS